MMDWTAIGLVVSVPHLFSFSMMLEPLLWSKVGGALALDWSVEREEKKHNYVREYVSSQNSIIIILVLHVVTISIFH